MSKIDKKALKKRGTAKLSSKKAVQSKELPATFDEYGRPRKTLIKRPRRPPANYTPRNKKELAKLTSEWYDYIKHKGFEDIEWFDPKTGAGQNSGFLKGSGSFYHTQDLVAINRVGGKDFVASQQLKYSMISNFLAHTTSKDLNFIARETTNATSKQLRYCLSLYGEGLTYRQIEKELAKVPQYWKPRSYFWVFKHLKPVLAYVKLWNKENPEGLLNPGQLDLMAKEVMIKEPGGSDV